MADAFPGALRRSLIATAAVVVLGTVGATCGVAVRGPAPTPPAAKASDAAPVAVVAPAHPESPRDRPSVAEGVK